MKALKKYLPSFLQNSGRYCLERQRIMSAKWRALPKFIIIGAAKAGTSSLYEYIRQHPQMRGASTKEVHYFSINYQKGVLWYKSHFPFKSSLSNKGLITGEATPYYLLHPHAPERIKDLIPDVKLIVVLRNPVDRAISHYFHQVRAKRETLLMIEAFEHEEKRLVPELQKMLQDPLYDSEIYQHFSYKKRGVYVDQIRAWHEVFPPEQMFILKSEDLFSDPSPVLKAVFEFLGIEPGFMPEDLVPRNVGGSNANVSDEVYKYLRDYFAPHNERLYTYMHRDFGW